MEDEVLFDIRGQLGVISLNRPRAINALTAPMCGAITRQLDAWRDDDAVAAIVITSTSDRGLCAGGDVKAVRQSVIDGDPHALDFFTLELGMDEALATYPKRVVALMDGIVMGGGLGISAHADLRVVTPRSKMAMPETGIGYFPDVGMMHPLSRAGNLGRHMALSGMSFGAGDALAAGIADVVVEDTHAVLDALETDPMLASDRLPGVLDAEPVVHGAEWLSAYEAEDPAAVVRALRQHGSDDAQAVADTIVQRSPYAAAVTWAAMDRAESLTLTQVFAQDLHLASTVVRQHDFLEGVRCRLVDKGESPQWNPDGWTGVDLDEVQHLVDSAPQG